MENLPSDWKKDIRRNHDLLGVSLEAQRRENEIVALIRGTRESELLQILGRGFLDVLQSDRNPVVAHNPPVR